MENDAIERILNKYEGQDRQLIRVMMEIQEENRWLPRDVMKKISERLDVPFSRVLRIATFYKTFSMTPKGRYELNICTGTGCHVRGAQQVLETVQDMLGIKPGETDADQKFTLEVVNCQGCCTCGPMIKVDDNTHSRISPAEVADALKKYD